MSRSNSCEEYDCRSCVHWHKESQVHCSSTKCDNNFSDYKPRKTKPKQTNKFRRSMSGY